MARAASRAASSTRTDARLTEYQVTSRRIVRPVLRAVGNSVRQDVASETGEFAVENAPAGALGSQRHRKGIPGRARRRDCVEEGETRRGVEVGSREARR